MPGKFKLKRRDRLYQAAHRQTRIHTLKHPESRTWDRIAVRGTYLENPRSGRVGRPETQASIKRLNP